MEVTGILALLVLAAVIYAILKIAQSSATTGMKVVWILVVLLFNIVGLIIWFLFGPGGNKK